MKNKQLWDAIDAFELDEPNVPRTFTKRLAEDNNWTHSYAKAVADEYKKFMYLACIMEVTPSKSIDEAWHLHLQYTRSYWKDFCGTVLGKEIHHNPGNGTDSDDTKYKNVYLETLEAYKVEFGVVPPNNVWGIDKEIIRDEKIITDNRRRSSKFGKLIGLVTGISSLVMMTSGTAILVILGIIGSAGLVFYIIYRALSSGSNGSSRRKNIRNTYTETRARTSSSSCGSSSRKRSKSSDDDSWIPPAASCSSACGSHSSCSSCSSSDSGSSSSCGSGGDSGGGGSSCGSSCGGGCGGGGD